MEESDLRLRACRLARTLSAPQRAHVRYGIAGALNCTLDALEKRGLIEPIPERPTWLKLSPLGELVSKILRQEACPLCGRPYPDRDTVKCPLCPPQQTKGAAKP